MILPKEYHHWCQLFKASTMIPTGKSCNQLQFQPKSISLTEKMIQMVVVMGWWLTSARDDTADGDRDEEGA